MVSKNLSGKTFGKLIALTGSRDLSKSDRCMYWNCICECGKYVIVRSSTLIQGKQKSCGCSKENFKSSKISLPKGEANINTIFKNYKQSAKKRGHDFLLIKEEFIKFLFDNCYYCGQSPYTKNLVKNINGDSIIYVNGIDRINNNVGYIKENCVTACFKCNMAKRDMSYQDFINWILIAAKHISERNVLNTQGV